MSDLDFGHIKRICESDAGHGMTKTALIHWVLGSIAEVERLETENLLLKMADVDHAQARAEGMKEGMRAYAWWKEGVEYVGTSGTTLKAALAAAKDNA